jgi:hypothetical protein
MRLNLTIQNKMCDILMRNEMNKEIDWGTVKL